MATSSSTEYQHPTTPYPTFTSSFASSPTPSPFPTSLAIPSFFSSSSTSQVPYLSSSAFPLIRSPSAPLRRAPPPPRRHIPKRARSNHIKMIEPERNGLWTVRESDGEEEEGNAYMSDNQADEPLGWGRNGGRGSGVEMGWGQAPEGFGLGLGVDMTDRSDCQDSLTPTPGSATFSGLFFQSGTPLPMTPDAQVSKSLWSTPPTLISPPSSTFSASPISPTARTRSWLSGRVCSSPFDMDVDEQEEEEKEDVFGRMPGSPTSSEESFGDRASPTGKSFLNNLRIASISSKRPPPLDLSFIPYSVDRSTLPSLGTPFSFTPRTHACSRSKKAASALLSPLPIFSQEELASRRHHQIPRTPSLMSCSDDSSTTGSTRSYTSSENGCYLTSSAEPRMDIHGDVLMSAFEDLLESCDEDHSSLASYAQVKGPVGLGLFPLPPFRLTGSSSVPSIDLPASSPSPGITNKRSSEASPPPPLTCITSNNKSRPALHSSQTQSSLNNSRRTNDTGLDLPEMPLTPLKARSSKRDVPALPINTGRPSLVMRTVTPSSSRALQSATGISAEQHRTHPDMEGRRAREGRRRLPERSALPQAWVAV